jgi:hypothetical protein
MKDLIFLPIEIDIPQTDFSIEKQSVKTFNGLWDTKILEDEINHPYIKHLIDQLPYQRVTLAKYNTQETDVPPHVDVQPSWTTTVDEYNHIVDNEPAGYRIILIGSNNKLEVHDGKQWRIAKVPKVPFAYLLHSTIYKHRVLGEVGRKTLYFRGYLNPAAHRELIEKNLQKYGEYAIYSQ